MFGAGALKGHSALCKVNGAMSMSEDTVTGLLSRVMSRVPTPADNKDLLRAADKSELKSSDGAADPEWRLQGILAKTRVTTNFGKVPAHLIHVGDRIRTRAGRYLPVKNIEVYKLDREYIERHSEALPVLIQQGAIDGKYPTQDVLLSPEQLVTLDGKHARADMVHAREIPRSRRTFDPSLGVVAYYKFTLEEPAEIYCEGVWVKSAA